MPRPSSTSPLTVEVARFNAELRRLAMAIVGQIFAQELAERQARTGAKARRSRARPARAPAVEEPPAAVAAGEAPAEAARDTTVEAPPSGKRRSWTRESVIEELATWLLSGTAVEPAFLKRHGQPGLVASAKRIFGRFDAALNAANLHLAQKYPAGPPTRKAAQPPRA